ncbi:MAG: hypothetical protein MJZ76_06475 [Bacteroidales bacterium]|nr:hypothetical protein [Bacteroidales bacterium]
MGTTKNELQELATVFFSDNETFENARSTFHTIQKALVFLWHWDLVTADALMMTGNKEEARRRQNAAREIRSLYEKAYGVPIREGEF